MNYRAKIIAYQININRLISVIREILIEFCNANVVGYDKIANAYWCKIGNNKYVIEIFKYSERISIVKFMPTIWNINLIEKFASNFTESIELYTTSSFIRGLLERKVGL